LNREIREQIEDLHNDCKSTEGTQRRIGELCDRVREDMKTFNAKAQRPKVAKEKMGSNFLFIATLHPGVFALNSGPPFCG
jgi:phosphoenolpyruvate carboxylase